MNNYEDDFVTDALKGVFLVLISLCDIPVLTLY